MIFRAGPVDVLEINAHSERFVLLRNHDNISEPLGVVYLSDKSCRQQSSHFLTNCFSLLYGGLSKMFLERFYFRVDSQTVLSQSPRYTWHVRRFPCKDVPVLTDELDERAFLFRIHISTDDELLG